jgi:MFS transporter, SP family, arabinose:H+ symporter
VLYFLLLLAIPESPRWLVMKNRPDEAKAIMGRVGGPEHAEREYRNIVQSLAEKGGGGSLAQARELFSTRARLILIIGVGLGVFQQVSGINSVLYYAPMIFESAGSGRDAAFVQAIAIGVVFLALTIVSMLVIDRLGRKPLLYIGVAMMALSLSITGLAFRNATYSIDMALLENVANEVFESDLWNEARRQHPGLVTFHTREVMDGFAEIVGYDRSVVRIALSDPALRTAVENRDLLVRSLSSLAGRVFNSELEYNAAIRSTFEEHASLNSAAYLPLLLKGSIHINSVAVLISILGFIAGFSLSLGPVMWAMFSEIFPNRFRGVAISFVGTLNSSTSFVVATLFPVQLSLLGSGTTFFVYAGFMFLCLLFVWRFVVETKGRSLEELELRLMR